MVEDPSRCVHCNRALSERHHDYCPAARRTACSQFALMLAVAWGIAYYLAHVLSATPW